MHQETVSPNTSKNGGRSTGARTALASIAAVTSVLAASSCCLPLVPFLLAAGFAGTSTVLSAARPVLLGTSVLSIAYGFYQARQAKKCRRRPGLVSSMLLWFSTVFVLIAILFPQIIANAAASLWPGEPYAPQAHSRRHRRPGPGRCARLLLRREQCSFRPGSARPPHGTESVRHPQ